MSSLANTRRPAAGDLYKDGKRRRALARRDFFAAVYLIFAQAPIFLGAAFKVPLEPPPHDFTILEL